MVKINFGGNPAAIQSVPILKMLFDIKFKTIFTAAAFFGISVVVTPALADHHGGSVGSLRGSLIGPDGLAIAGALVEVVETTDQTWTDGVGRYSFIKIAAGTYIIRVVADNFEPIETSVTVDGPTEAPLAITEVQRRVASVEVVGEAAETLAEIPGSIFMVTQAEIENSNPVDANEVLRRVPGLVPRVDSGPVGLRLNVGIRGLNPDRSRKILMLEDGIPVALAPYGEPEMYYSPSIDRMSRVEVLKGSGQIIHGPQSVGGVINFVTPEPPSKFHGDFDVKAGEYGTRFANGSLGGSNRDQTAGWYTSYLHKQGDGWRKFYFDVDTINTKLTLKPWEGHTFSFKGGIYNERSNATYLGITTPMYETDYTQNPVPGDTLAVDRRSGSISHTYAIDSNTVWNTSAYAYSTRRYWGRTDFDRSDKGKDYIGVFGDPLVAGGAIFLRDSAGNRNRDFDVFGLQTGIQKHHNLGKLDIGIRYLYEQANDKRVNGTGYRARTGEIRDDEDRLGRAFAAHAQHQFKLGDRILFTPGVRLERYEQVRHIRRTRVKDAEGNKIPTNVDRRQDNFMTAVIPGLSLAVKAAPGVMLFSGVHRGWAPPRTKKAITSSGENLDLDAEKSWNYEVGIRLGQKRAIQAELAYFRLDFSNQIIAAAESGGATTTLVNAGSSMHEGLEANVRINWNELANISGWSIFSELRFMYLATAEFRDNALYSGNRLPYAPENCFGLVFGVRQYDGLGFQLDTSEVGDRFGDNNMTMATSGDGTVGLLSAYGVINFSVDYTVRQERYTFRPYFTVKNLLDAKYIASRAPQGIYPGHARAAIAGIKFSF